jgi:hypothetical protein
MDPFEPVAVDERADPFVALSRRPVGSTPPPSVLPAAVTARLRGFDLDDRPLIVGLPDLPGEIVPAVTSVSLRRDMVDSTVVVLFDQGDVRRPIIVGVLQDRLAPPAEAALGPAQRVLVQADDERVVVTAEREIVLRCGDASITLTRAGKVLIKGTYVLSRARGYNKIKGAAVDIN